MGKGNIRSVFIKSYGYILNWVSSQESLRTLSDKRCGNEVDHLGSQGFGFKPE